MGVLLLAGVLAALLAGYGWLTLPRTQGEVRLAGASADVRIERDTHGIPTIVAATALDA